MLPLYSNTGSNTSDLLSSPKKIKRRIRRLHSATEYGLRRYSSCMATKTLTLLHDDLDGSAAAETVSFALDGALYEIDLSDQNARALRDVLSRWIAPARRLRGPGRTGVSGMAKPFDQVDNRAVRAWASANKIEISNRGRIAAEVIEQYRKAGN
jgi:hypothetical protein